MIDSKDLSPTSNDTTSDNRKSITEDHRPPKLNSDDRIRLFLVVSIIVLTILILIVFAVTKDPNIIAANTIFASAVTFVFAYYFCKR